jgi:DNA primase
MDNSKYILGLLESVLGKSKPDKNGSDHTFHCPICKHKKPKLVVNTKTGQYNCWTCHPPTKGKTPVSLFKKLQVSTEIIMEMKQYFSNDKTSLKDYNPTKVSLPEEFISLSIIPKNINLEYRHAMSYLKNRNITTSDIKKYNIGYCSKGRYRNRIIVPSHDKDGHINYFIARSFEKEPRLKYDAPSVSKTDIVGFEYYVNWKIPVILCEGAFDAIAIKRNAIPLFGKIIQPTLQKKIIEKRVRDIYICLDADALRNAIQIAERFMAEGLNVYFVELQDDDASELGFQQIREILNETDVLTFERVMQLKMDMIWK